MVYQLRLRTSGQLVERAWKVLELFHQYYKEFYSLSTKYYLVVARLTIQAWEKRARALQDLSPPSVEAPAFIGELESLLSMHEPGAPTMVDKSLNPFGWIGNAEQPRSSLRGQFGGFGWMESFDWDMFSPEG